MRVAVTGGSGLVGTALCAGLEEPVPFVHGRDWDWRSGRLDAARLRACDAVVHLAGAGIADRRWSAARRQELRDSRVRGTALIAGVLAADPGRVRTLVCASAVGIYGDRGDETLTEDSPPGTGFLAGLCRDWEAAAQPAPVRLVRLRLGLVLAAQGGALARMLPAARLGLGGRLGSGRQWWPWIALPDLVALIRCCLEDAGIAGPVLAVAPAPLQQRDVARTLAAVLRRPCWAPPAPAWMLRLALGSMVDETLLASSRAIPQALIKKGFVWSLPHLHLALSSLLDTSGPFGKPK